MLSRHYNLDVMELATDLRDTCCQPVLSTYLYTKLTRVNVFFCGALLNRLSSAPSPSAAGPNTVGRSEKRVDVG